MKQPLAILRQLDKLGKGEDMFSSMIDNLFHFHGFSPLQGINNPDFSPVLDFVDKEKKYTINIEIPGIEKNNIQIEIDDGILIIKGEKKSEKRKDDDELYVCERCYGMFRREIRLPADANKNDINAKYENGILLLDIPKIETPEKETKMITIS